MMRIMTAQNDNESKQLNLNVYHLPSEKIKDHDPEIFKAKRYEPFSCRLAVVHFLNGWAMNDWPLTESVKQIARSYVCEFPEFAEEVRELRPELLEL